MERAPAGIVLFSGGLDSLLAAKLLEAQGLKVLCIHFYTPFFGDSDAIDRWRSLYDLEIQGHDLSLPFMRMLHEGPPHGFGKHLNPCVDCKILQLKAAKTIMDNCGAKFLATGEVPGQRPMSQRRDSLNTIENQAQIRDILLRPLSAQHFAPTEAERMNLVDRSKLPGFWGRNRTPQLELARELGLRRIPAPAGGCALTEVEKARRYWKILARYRKEPNPDHDAMARDFALSNTGRQFWHDEDWLIIGRNRADNEILIEARSADDLILRLDSGPGPVGLSIKGAGWSDATLQSAAALVASYSTKALSEDRMINIRVTGRTQRPFLTVTPRRDNPDWNVPDWQTCRPQIRSLTSKANS